MSKNMLPIFKEIKKEFGFTTTNAGHNDTILIADPLIE